MASSANSRFKRPESVLVVLYTRTGEVLLLKRSDHLEFWQSVTGSMQWDESEPRLAAAREVYEETGMRVDPAALRDLGLVQRYAIFPQWRYRYAPEVTENTEHAFALELPRPVVLAGHPEHTDYAWVPFAEAVGRVASWSNRVALERIAAAR